MADVIGIKSKNYNPENIRSDRLYTGIRKIEITDEEVQKLYTDGFIETEKRLYPNQFVVMEDSCGGVHYGVFNGITRKVELLPNKLEAWGISPKKDKDGNVIVEQKMLLYLLMNPDIHFVSAVGPSGCGKTLLTLAAALEQTLHKEQYSKIVIMRPLVAIGKDIGYLPGDKLEKLEAWMGSAFDNLEYLLSSDRYTIKDMDRMYISMRDKVYDLIDKGYVELEAMTYIRGRSIPGQFIIVDDAQNLSIQQAVSIITRAGIGSKLVFLGDLSDKQIDNHRLTPSNNGLAYVIDRLKGETITGHITLSQVVRSPLAEIAVRRL
jgi:PhoH-like ATPase